MTPPRRWRLEYLRARGNKAMADTLHIAYLVSVGPEARAELRRLLDEAEATAARWEAL